MHPGPHAQRIIAHAREPQVQRRHSGLPCAAVYGLLRALPGEPAFATVARAKPLEPRSTLTPCLCAPEPHGFAVRLRAARQSAQRTSAALRSTFVTIAIRPLCRCGVGAVNHKFLKIERRIFLCEGLDRANQVERTRKIRFLPQRQDLPRQTRRPAGAHVQRGMRYGVSVESLSSSALVPLLFNLRPLFSIGANPFQSPFAVARQHLGVMSPESQQRNLELQHWSKRLEPDIQRTGDAMLLVAGHAARIKKLVSHLRFLLVGFVAVHSLHALCCGSNVGSSSMFRRNC